jgi:hypothetical protein
VKFRPTVTVVLKHCSLGKVIDVTEGEVPLCLQLILVQPGHELLRGCACENSRYMLKGVGI